ncbi:metallophosphoesterase family protein [Nocardia gipuzkoensis]
MRILHTSDWHLGFQMQRVPLLPAQESVLVEDIADLVEDCEVDVVVVAGDVYDKADPSELEISVCQKAFTAIRAAGAELVVIPGNHDSPIRLGAGAAFTAAGGLHLVTDPSAIGTPVRFSDEHGPIAIYGIPSPRSAGVGCSGPKPEDEYWRAAMARVRADLAEQSQEVRSMVVAHAAVADPAARGLDRIRVGGRTTVPVEVFAGMDYVALGDLHWPHAVSPTVRYSGSPLPYIYDVGPRIVDTHPAKSVSLIDFGPTGLIGVTECPLLVPSGMVRVEGTVAELLSGNEHSTTCARR